MTGGRSTEVLAHGLGGSTDLPIPYTYALIGAAWALTFTFAVVALAWKKPRFDAARPGRPLPAVGDDGGRRARDALGGGRRGAAVRGVGGGRRGRSARRTATTPLPGVFYVLLWVGLVALSLAIGPVWRVLSPVRTLYRLLPLSRRAAAVDVPARAWATGPPSSGCSRSCGSSSPAPTRDRLPR